jgi:SAM-dependent methyltransferase
MDDVEGIGGDELRETLRELRVINRRLGGYVTSWRALDDLALRAQLERGRKLAVLDVGGGSGDAAPAILRWAQRRGFDVRVTVVDIHPDTVEEARRRLGTVEGVDVRLADLFEIAPRSFDIVHAALFLHHFDGDEAARAMTAMGRIARVGVVVNDLHRHPVPWTLIRWITGIASRNRLIRADAPHSVARAFIEQDWRALATSAGLDLEWRRVWAWRWAVSGLPAEELG